MWPFKRKKPNREPLPLSLVCTFCKSAHTTAIHRPDSIKAWRGRRFVTCRCLDCGREFYAEEPLHGLPANNYEGGELVEDEEALQAAEDDLKKQLEDEDDRRCK